MSNHGIGAIDAAGDATREAWLSAGKLLQNIEAEARDHVPMSVVMDFALAGIDRDILNARYGAHLADCEACARGIAAAEGIRPKDQCELHRLPEFAHCGRREENYKLESVAKVKLAEFIGEDTGTLVIVAGEANPHVYDKLVSDALAERAENALRRGAALPMIICGPAMGTGGEIHEPQDAVLPKLAEAGLVDLFAARHRIGVHFRANLGLARVFTEAYHGAGDPRERRGVWYSGRAIADLFHRRFLAIVDAGLATRAGREDFEYVPMEAIGKIAERHGNEEFDRASRDQIREWAAQVA